MGTIAPATPAPDRRPGSAPPPASASTCPACQHPVYLAEIWWPVTVTLGALPTPRGRYYYDHERGVLCEDLYGHLVRPCYDLHRCGLGGKAQ